MTDGEKLYELAYLLSPLLAAEVLPETVEKCLKTVLAAHASGAIEEITAPRRLALSYPIRQDTARGRTVFREAYFGALRFSALPASAAALAGQLRRIPEFVRHLLIEVPKVALVDAARLKIKSPPRRRPTSATYGAAGGGAPRPAMSQVEIDQEIDQLLTGASYKADEA